MPFIFVVLMILWAVFNMISRQTNGKQQQANRNAASKPASPVKQNAPAPGAPVRKMFSQQLPPREQIHEKPHTPTPLEAHMHTPVMDAEGEGFEGQDCCHEYMLEDTPLQEETILPAENEEAKERANALLQGVIFSEILGRRPVKRYGGKHA